MATADGGGTDSVNNTKGGEGSAITKDEEDSVATDDGNGTDSVIARGGEGTVIMKDEEDSVATDDGNGTDSVIAGGGEDSAATDDGSMGFSRGGEGSATSGEDSRRSATGNSPSLGKDGCSDLDSDGNETERFSGCTGKASVGLLLTGSVVSGE